MIENKICKHLLCFISVRSLSEVSCCFLKKHLKDYLLFIFLLKYLLFFISLKTLAICILIQCNESVPIFFKCVCLFSLNYSQHPNALFVFRSMEEDELSCEFDGDDNEIEMGTDEQELDNIEMEKPLEGGENLEEVVIEPHRGMLFGSIEEVHEYYTRYARRIGFAVAQRSSKKGSDGKKMFVTFACTKGRKLNPSASTPVKLHPQ